MATFQELRQQLQALRSQHEAADDAAARARERLLGAREAGAAFDRAFNPGVSGQVAERDRLKAAREAAEAELKKRENELKQLGPKLTDALKAFAAEADPTKAITQFKDQFPLLLLPVRLETRFKDVTVAGAPRRQLWVRVYPDDCSIDTFEGDLTQDEVANARAFWAGVWRAGGVVDQARGAWRGLVESHGSGRAAWIVTTYRPLNPADRPKKAKPTDVVLAVPTDAAPAAAEATAVAAFWAATWKADGDAAKANAARAALEAAVGAARAAELTALLKPVNLDEAPAAPPTKAQTGVSTAFVVFPKADAVPTKAQGWTRAPKAALLPERFVFLGFSGAAAPKVVVGNPVPSPLVVGPDPVADKAEQLAPKDGDLVVPEAMKWMVDFDRAVEQGMGFRVDLDGVSNGFDRVMVLGVRLSADEQESAAALAQLLGHHRFGRRGFALVPQGTPTNNTEAGGAGYTRADDADGSFNDLFKNGDPLLANELFAVTADPLLKKDGQWLAEWLGVPPDTFQQVRHAGGTDQLEARALNAALWPATLGYWMETMMQPVFDAAVEDTREFFAAYVSGRGPVPAVRVGHQPYGILPTTAFSRMGAGLTPPPGGRPDPAVDYPYLRGLYGVLRKVDEDWATLVAQVAFAGKPGDAQQALLDVLGLHPTSVEFAQRYAQGLTHLYNQFNLWGTGPDVATVVASTLSSPGMRLLTRLGYGGNARPDMLNKFFVGKHNPLKGPLVDDRPLSEAEPVRAYTASGQNYLEWLIQAANTSADALRLEDGFLEDQPPKALLYLLLRHALLLGSYDVGVRLHERRQLFTAAQASIARREAPFVHAKAGAGASESRYALLLKPEPAITSNPTQRVGEFIAKSLRTLPDARHLRGQVRGLELLAKAPTARLERVLAEHLDCCSYRLDAWMLGVVHYQLAAMRRLHGPGEVVRGVYLGAYAWLENVRPEARALTPVSDLDAELKKVFLRPAEGARPADPPLLRDSANQGFVHAPSLNQAVAAAVLRNGYLSDASPANRQTLAVNLSSERVRTALGVLEGVRNGQAFGALLGYQFERGLHDRHGLAEVDKFIYKIRKVFPLRADRLGPTKTPEGVSIEAVEARNVMDGLSFVNHVKATGAKTYPFGKALPAATPAEQAAINAEADRLLDTADAVADLALAEGVYQAVQGNYDRAAATLDAFGRGAAPPEPEVVRTPTSGVGLTHRVGLHLPAGASPTASPVPGLAMTPRATAEPALNAWLASVLPPLDQVGCQVAFRGAANAPVTRGVSLRELGLQPLDVLFLLQGENRQAMSELDDRVVRAVVGANAPRPDGGVEIRYLDRGGLAVSVFELMPLVRSLRRLVLASRPLRASDLTLGNEAGRAQDEAVSADEPRVVRARDAMQNARAGLVAFRTALEGVQANPAAALANADGHVQQAANLIAEAARFGVPQSGWGFAYEWRQRQFRAVLDRAAKLVERWDGRLAEFDALIAAHDALPAAAPAAERFALLRRAEALVTTAPTQPTPATPDALKAQVLAKRAAFAARRGQFAALKTTNRTALGPLLADVNALLPVAVFDPEPFEVTADVQREAGVFAADLLNAVKALVAELDRRLAAAQAALTAHAAAAAAPARVAALQAAAKALFGDDFPLVPEFRLAPDRGEELAKAVIAGPGELLKFLRDAEKVDFPVDDWLYGVARVRGKMRDWEQVVLLAGGFNGDGKAPELTPAQLPFKAGDSWLALKFPAAEKLDTERLLYTAHFAKPFDKAGKQCGLLLDEWTEVIPAADAMTGLAFHYDRPNSEPPQAMLLVVPPEFRGQWQWGHLVAALQETLELAKKRAVEPAHFDGLPYAQLLPATVAAVTRGALTISANFALNNDVHKFLKQD